MEKNIFKELELISDEAHKVEVQKEYCNELDKISVRKSYIGLILLSILLIASLMLFNSVSKLAVIHPVYYIAIVIISIIFFGFFIGLYVLNYKRKPKDENGLKTRFKCFQIFDLLYFIIVSFSVIYFIVMFVVTPARVSGSSMESTYSNGDQLLIWHLSYTPKLDDVVVVDTINMPNISIENVKFLIKRVVGLPGDKVTYDEGKLYINDKYVEDIDYETYVRLLTYRTYDEITTYYEEQTIPEGKYIVLGDNRDNSSDSRSVGLINGKDIIGKSIFRILPLMDIGVPKKQIR